MRSEVYLPDFQVWIALSIQQRTTNVFPKDAPFVGRWPRGVKFHLPFIQKKMFHDPTSEVSILVGTNPHDPWLFPTVSPHFALLVEEVDAVPRQPFDLE